MKKLFILTLTFAWAAIVSAEIISRIQIGDLYYNLNTENQTAEVTYKSCEYMHIGYTQGYFYNYEWEIATADIPATITYNEELYTVTSIGELAFCECANLQSVVIDSGVITIDKDAFRSCKNLTSVTMPGSITSIGQNAFGGCEKMTSVSIPTSVRYIGSGAFTGCNLNEVHITDLSAWCNIDYGEMDWASVTANPLIYAHNLFLNGELVTDLVIPDDITEIKDEAFAYCNCLTSVTISDNVSTIAKAAFFRCANLDSLSIGKNVTETGVAAFSGCSKLTAVTCKASTPPTLGRSSFANINCSEIPLYVPIGSEELYRGADQWKDFNPIIGIEVPEEQEGIKNTSALQLESTTKLLRNGQLLILRGDKTYTLQGQEVR